MFDKSVFLSNIKKSTIQIMTTLFKKLNYKNQPSILCLDAPDSFDNELDAMSSLASIYTEQSELTKIDFAIIFVTQQQAIEQSIADIFPQLNGDAILWYAYPKSSSKKYKCNFNRDTGWDALGTYNLEGVRQVSIDEDWSALRFRKIEYIKTMTRTAKNTISESGKNRIKDNQ